MELDIVNDQEYNKTSNIKIEIFYEKNKLKEIPIILNKSHLNLNFNLNENDSIKNNIRDLTYKLKLCIYSNNVKSIKLLIDFNENNWDKYTILNEEDNFKFNKNLSIFLNSLKKQSKKLSAKQNSVILNTNDINILKLNYRKFYFLELFIIIICFLVEFFCIKSAIENKTDIKIPS